MTARDPDGFDLRQLQQWLQAVITHHGGIESGIESDDARHHIDVTTDDIERVISPSENLTSIERLGVYGNAYYARLVECLRESFPALVHALGQDVFDEFAFSYLQRYPSESYTLNRLGDRFMQHLQETRPDADQHALGEVDWPDFLIDLATLEWNIEKIFDGPGYEGQSLLDAEQLQAIPADRWPDVTLIPVPCLHIFAFRFPVNTYFTQHHRLKQLHALEQPGGEKLTIPAPSAQFVALSRREYIVRRFELEQSEFELLRRIVAGQSIGKAIEAVVESSAGDVEDFAERLQQWFRKWTGAGFFQTMKMP